MVDRPTFNESWYRVANLKPRLRSMVQTYRQHYRGQTWHVVADPSNNEYFRLDKSAYFFIGLMDGKRTVEQAWKMCQEQLGDAAPTQGEAIHLMGRLYICNLIQADMPADTRNMFNRQRKRRRKEVGGQLLNFMFVRMPLLDPDRFLDRWVKLVGWVFTRGGFILWSLLLMMALVQIGARHDELTYGAGNVLDPANLIWLSIAFWGVKAIHEFGHAFACKKFGIDNSTGGEVHTMGIMLMVLMPIPFVDASSAWAFGNKWHRLFVASAGMYVELAVAAVAAIVWAHTAGGTTVHAVAYNVMFVAGVSTLVFNGNPLLRYDAYYMLSDYLETPNLAQRSKQYLSYLVRKYIFGLEKAQDPTHDPTERRWFVPYAVASGIYRIFVSIGIVMFVADQLFFVGLIMAGGAVMTWLIVPVFRFVQYLATNSELSRARSRAVVSSMAATALLALAVTLIPMPDSGRAEGIVEPRRMAIVYVGSEGFVERVLATGRQVGPDGEALLALRNPELQTMRDKTLAEKRLLEARQRAARAGEAADVQSFSRQIQVLQEQIQRIDERIAMLEVHAPFPGVWVAPDIDSLQGAFVPRGEQIGVVASIDDLIIRVTADQNLGPRIEPEIGLGGAVEVRVMGRPDIRFTGSITKVLPAGQQLLPSAALGLLGGGTMQVDSSDESGTRATESFFEVRIDPVLSSKQVSQLFTGQRVVVRFKMPAKPLVQQAWRSVRQLLQRRFQM